MEYSKLVEGLVVISRTGLNLTFAGGAKKERCQVQVICPSTPEAIFL